jgi:protein tyrosine/serine phosphatase
MREQFGTLRLAVFGILLCASACFAGQKNESKSHPAERAISLARPGLPNFYEVTTNFYRGAQPTAQGIAELKAMGVKTILNLRSFHSDIALIANGELKLARLHMKPWHAEDEDVVKFLKIAGNTNSLPMFVHCQRGADRTGLVCAVYRIAACGWTKEQAITEMKDGGFAFNSGLKNLVAYIEQADIETLKKRAGLSAK